MISIIVPVFKVEKYLQKCIDSILVQSYQDIEILLIDDGSPDLSGKICDEYRTKDSRIKVFHIDNIGLSGARNYGLAHANGEYIGFIDSDDWIDPDMYESLIAVAFSTNADVVECGFYDEYPKRSVKKKWHPEIKTYSRVEAVKAHLYGEINSLFMTKLWKRCCFQKTSFPTGHVFEDTLIMYKVLDNANSVIGLDKILYHHTIREDSISHDDSLETLSDSWHANKVQYLDLMKKEPYCSDQKLMKHLLHNCAGAFSAIWCRYYGCSLEEKNEFKGLIEEIYKFASCFYPLLGFSNWSVKYRTAVILAHFNSKWSLILSYYLSKAFCHKDTMEPY